MKIIVNGITREMTFEEQDKFDKEHKNLPAYPEGALDREKAIAYDILIGSKRMTPQEQVSHLKNIIENAAKAM